MNQESKIMKELEHHENIIQLIQVIEDSDSLFLVMEIAEQPIIDIIPQSFSKAYSNKQCKKYFKQILDSVDHLHKHDIIHGDIKPENILLTNKKTVKLIDFGNATHIPDLERPGVATGSPAFMAPELLKKVPHSHTSPDTWATGVTLYCLVYGKLPFEKPSFIQLHQEILNSPVSHLETIDPNLKDLINQLLEKDPSKRITIEKAKQHPWLN